LAVVTTAIFVFVPFAGMQGLNICVMVCEVVVPELTPIWNVSVTVPAKLEAVTGPDVAVPPRLETLKPHK
jgi:hypothetical protein